MESIGFVLRNNDHDYEISFRKVLNNKHHLRVLFREREVIIKELVSTTKYPMENEAAYIETNENTYNTIVEKIDYFIDNYNNFISIKEYCKFVDVKNIHISINNKEIVDIYFDVFLFKPGDLAERPSFGYRYSINHGNLSQII